MIIVESQIHVDFLISFTTLNNIMYSYSCQLH